MDFRYIKIHECVSELFFLGTNNRIVKKKKELQKLCSQASYTCVAFFYLTYIIHPGNAIWRLQFFLYFLYYIKIFFFLNLQKKKKKKKHQRKKNFKRSLCVSIHKFFLFFLWRWFLMKQSYVLCLTNNVVIPLEKIQKRCLRRFIVVYTCCFF